MGIQTLEPELHADRVSRELAKIQAEQAEYLAPGEDLESYLDRVEAEQHASLAAQLERSEKGFREGRFTTWEEVKRRNGL